MINPLVLTAILAALPAAVTAGEVWQTEMGGVIHQRDIGDMAVFSIPLDEITGLIYLPGLADGRMVEGSLTGFWISDEVGPCPAELRSPEGLMSDSWGKVEIVFDSPANRGNWTMHLGACFNAPHLTLRGLLK